MRAKENICLNFVYIGFGDPNDTSEATDGTESNEIYFDGINDSNALSAEQDDLNYPQENQGKFNNELYVV